MIFWRRVCSNATPSTMRRTWCPPPTGPRRHNLQFATVVQVHVSQQEIRGHTTPFPVNACRGAQNGEFAPPQHSCLCTSGSMMAKGGLDGHISTCARSWEEEGAAVSRGGPKTVGIRSAPEGLQDVADKLIPRGPFCECTRAFSCRYSGQEQLAVLRFHIGSHHVIVMIWFSGSAGTHVPIETMRQFYFWCRGEMQIGAGS